MFETVTAPLEGWRTNPLIETIVLNGWDYTGATIRLEVRDRRDGGALRAGLDTVASAASEGVRIASVTTAGVIPTTTLVIRINETTMEAMPAAPEAGDDIPMVWGMHITPLGGLKFMAFDGPFTVKASVPA